MDIKKLKKKQIQIIEFARQEVIDNIKENLIQIVLDEDVHKIFHQEKNRNIAKLSKRVVSHWIKKGLIEAEQSKTGGWYHFSQLEAIWIEIITNLRQFGVELDKIKEIRKQLFTEEIRGFSLLEYTLMHSVLKEPYVLLVFQNGTIQLLTITLYGKYLSTKILAPHITLNLYHLAEDIFPNNNFHLGQKENNIADLNNAELKLLYFIRTGSFQNIKIRLNENDVYLIEGTKTVSNFDSLIQIIKENKYQDIEIKTEKGNVVNVTCTEKIRLE